MREKYNYVIDLSTRVGLKYGDAKMVKFLNNICDFVYSSDPVRRTLTKHKLIYCFKIKLNLSNGKQRYLISERSKYSGTGKYVL